MGTRTGPHGERDIDFVQRSATGPLGRCCEQKPGRTVALFPKQDSVAHGRGHLCKEGFVVIKVWETPSLKSLISAECISIFISVKCAVRLQ